MPDRPARPRHGDGRERSRSASRAHAAERAWFACLLLGLLVLAGDAAHAQFVEDFRTQATMRTGPLYLKPGISLERLGFDSNVFRRPEAQPDFVVSVTPRVDLWLPLRHQARVSATLLARTDWYAEHAGERAFNPELHYRVDLPWRRLVFSAGGSRLRTRRRPDFEIDARSNRFARELHGGVAVELLSRLWLDVEARQRVVGFDADAILEGTYLSETLNRRERGTVASLRWQRTALTTFVVESEVRAVRFFRSPERNNDNVILTAGADFHPRALVAGSGRIGIRRFRARGDGVDDVSRLVADAALSFRLTGRTEVTFDAVRDIDYSFDRVSPFYVVNRYGLRITRRLGSQADLSGRVGRDLYAYRSVGAVDRRRDVRWIVSGQFGYRLSPRIRTGLEVGYARRDSTTWRFARYDGLVLGMLVDYDL